MSETLALDVLRIALAKMAEPVAAAMSWEQYLLFHIRTQGWDVVDLEAHIPQAHVDITEEAWLTCSCGWEDKPWDRKTPTWTEHVRVAFTGSSVP